MTMNDQPMAELLIDYYRGAYGPTIRVSLASAESIRALLKVLKELADGNITQVKLQERSGIRVSGLKDFVLRALPTEEEPKKTLSISHDEEPSVRWERSRKGWMTSAELVRALIVTEQSGHQYLTNEGIDDALIEVAFKE